MLEQQDYNQIKQIFNEEGKKLFEAEGKKLFEVEGKKLEKNIIMQLGEVIEDNILPILEENTKELKDFIEEKIAPLPDKDFVSREQIKAESINIARHKQANKKTNLLTKFLQDKKVLLDEEIEKINQIEIFANRPEVKPQIEQDEIHR